MAPPSARHVALVSAGGAFGALGRYAVDVAAPVGPGDLPWGTFGVNVAGCFLLALLVARTATDSWLRPLLGAGVLGGFTTMSAYAEQSRSLLADDRPGTALLYVGGTLAACLVAVAAGARAARR